MRGPALARDIDVAAAFGRALGLLDRARLATKLEESVGRDVDLIDLDEASTLLRWQVLPSPCTA